MTRPVKLGSQELNKRVFMLVTDAFGGYGGIALYNRDVIEALCGMPEIERVVAVARWQREALPPIPKKLDYHTNGTRGWLAFIVESLRHGLRGKYDAIICCHINLVPIAWLLRAILGIPVVLQIYGLEAWQPTGRTITNRLVRKMDYVVSISRYTLNKFLAWSRFDRQRCHLVANAVHLEHYDASLSGERFRSRYNLEGRAVLLTFGRLVSKERAKGFDEVLDVLPDIRKEIPLVSYLIAGAGPDLQRLQSKAAELGLQDIVHFTDMVDEKEKNELYCAADLFVMPSRGEGFGFVILEALACGIPAIGSKIDGSREALLDGELGTLVDPDNPEELKAAIRSGLGKSRQVPEGLSELSYEKFTERFSAIMRRAMGTVTHG